MLGSSLGGVIFPIMLNHLINSGLGFAWGVRYGLGYIVREQVLNSFRIVAFMVMGLLIVANVIARPNYPPTAPSVHGEKTIWSFFSDIPYMIAIAGCII